MDLIQRAVGSTVGLRRARQSTRQCHRYKRDGSSERGKLAEEVLQEARLEGVPLRVSLSGQTIALESP